MLSVSVVDEVGQTQASLSAAGTKFTSRDWLAIDTEGQTQDCVVGSYVNW